MRAKGDAGHFRRSETGIAGVRGKRLGQGTQAVDKRGNRITVRAQRTRREGAQPCHEIGGGVVGRGFGSWLIREKGKLRGRHCGNRQSHPGHRRIGSFWGGGD